MNKNEVIEECPYPDAERAIWDFEWMGGADGYKFAAWLRLQADELEQAETEVREAMESDEEPPLSRLQKVQAAVQRQLQRLPEDGQVKVVKANGDVVDLDINADIDSQYGIDDVLCFIHPDGTNVAVGPVGEEGL